MTVLTLNPLTLDHSAFVEQFQAYLADKPVWKGTLTTQTSSTLLDLIAAVGAFDQGRLTRAYEDAFSETAQSDDAIRAITQMQGLRISRKLPASLEADLDSPADVTLDPLTQFLIGGQYYFNKEQITLEASVTLPVTLYQGKVLNYIMNGLGSPRQTYLSAEDSFQVSDQDVVVLVNDTIIPKSFGGLWNYRDLPAYGDLTTADGRLLIVFGSDSFGTTPLATDTVVIRYPLTDGASGGNQLLSGKAVTVDGLATVTGVATSNPSGGGDEKPIQTYKNLSSGAFGTYESAVTKAQYEATVGVYPGIVDAVTQAQRDINPLALEWMNVIRVSGLTTSPWSQQQKADFTSYLQRVTMYAPRFVWQDAISVPRAISLTVYCFNTAILSKVQAACVAAIQALFAPRPGLLMTNFYESDLIEVCKAAGAGAVSYVIVQEPTIPMIVTAPVSPELTYTLLSGGGTLGEYMYSYSVTSTNLDGEEGPPNKWVFPQVISPTDSYGIQLDWDPLPDVLEYKVYGRKSGEIGLMATIDPDDPLTFIDDGSVVPSEGAPNSIAQVPIRYNSISSLVVNVEFAERQQRLNTTPVRGQT